MSFEEMVVAIIGTIAGVGFLGFVIAKITGLIKAWINRNNNSIPEEQFNRLAKAFMQHRKESEQRIKNLEAALGTKKSDSTKSSQKSSKQIEAPRQEIEIEDRETEEKESGSQDDNNLRNMLRE